MWTWLAIVTLIVLIILFIVLYIWLYILAEKQESRIKKNKEAHRRIAEMLGSIIDSPTETSQASEIQALEDYIEKDKKHRIDILSNILIEGMLQQEEDERGRKAFYMVFEALRPQKYYSKMLREGSLNEKAYACKMLSAFFQEDEIPEIRKYINNRNKELSYNASMALSILGDEDGLVKHIVSCKDNYEYSHRIILELFSVYSGDVKNLASRILEDCNDYIKATIFKAVAKYKIREFEFFYLQGSKSKDANLRVASIKALCEIGDSKYEQTLIIASHDNMWFVRSTAVKGLGKMNSENSRQALLDAVKDKEWWVRYNAAHTLVSMEGGLEMAEHVLSGYDRFAADAVKYALYKTYDI